MHNPCRVDRLEAEQTIKKHGDEFFRQPRNYPDSDAEKKFKDIDGIVFDIFTRTRLGLVGERRRRLMFTGGPPRQK